MLESDVTRTVQECVAKMKKAGGSEFCSPASEAKIRDMERYFRFPLPIGYREFLKVTNGARMLDGHVVIFGLSMIGDFDPAVPEGYMLIGELGGERLVISEDDGRTYLCIDGDISRCSFEDICGEILRKCEERICQQ